MPRRVRTISWPSDRLPELMPITATKQPVYSALRVVTLPYRLADGQDYTVEVGAPEAADSRGFAWSDDYAGARLHGAARL